MKTKRTVRDKLHTLFFGKDLRVTEGEPYTQVRDGDYSSYYPLEKYINYNQSLPEEYYDIRDFRADTNKTDAENTRSIQKALDECHKNGGGTVLIADGIYVITTIYLHSDTTLFIEKNSAISANNTGN